jgi:hypothetical protein
MVEEHIDSIGWWNGYCFDLVYVFYVRLVRAEVGRGAQGCVLVAW